jgi:hypothetical protein
MTPPYGPPSPPAPPPPLAPAQSHSAPSPQVVAGLPLPRTNSPNKPIYKLVDIPGGVSIIHTSSDAYGNGRWFTIAVVYHCTPREKRLISDLLRCL